MHGEAGCGLEPHEGSGEERGELLCVFFAMWDGTWAAADIGVDPQAEEPLGKFLDYCTYGHMIDNVVLIVTGTLHDRDHTVSE